MPIRFYRVNEPYGAFSNFAKYSLEYEGKIWATSEHFFQAQKCRGTPHEETVRNAPTAKDAARIGRDRNLPMRSDWEEVKLDIMRQAVRLKFTQHAELADLLLSTGDEEIIEQTGEDYFWGCGSDGTGLNMLGRILMELREEWRETKKNDAE